MRSRKNFLIKWGLSGFLILLLSSQVQAITITISGTLYSDEGITPITSADQSIHLVIDGVSMGTSLTDGSGNYSFTVNVTDPYMPLLVYVDNGSVVGTTVTVLYSSTPVSINDLHIYANHLITRQDEGGTPLDNGDISNAVGNYSDTDILYSTTGSDLTVQGTNTVLYIPTGHSYTPSGNINAHHVEINGTLGLGTNTMNVSGDWEVTNGTFNRDTSTVNFTGSGTIRNDITTWWDNPFYNLTAAVAGQTTTILANRGTVVKNIITLGTGTLAGGTMVMNKSGTPFITAGATLSNAQFKYSPPAGETVNITAAIYPDLWLAENSTSSNSSFIVSGDINCDTLIIRGNSPGKTSHVTTNGPIINCNDVEIGHSSSSRAGKLILNNNSRLTIRNNLTIFNQSGANELDTTGLTTSDFTYDIIIVGHWRNFDTFTARTNSSVLFAGTQDQEVTSSGSPFFNLLKLDFTGTSTSTLTLQDPLTTNGFFVVLAGKVDTNATSNYDLTIFGLFAQSSAGYIGELEANFSTITAHGDFVADGTLDSTNYNNATLILPNTGTLGYTNLSQPWSNGFGNLIVGQAGNTTTLTNRMAVKNQLTVGSGSLEGATQSLFLSGNNPLSFDNNSTVNLYSLRFFGLNQTFPPLNNGYDSHIFLSLNNTNVTQTGDITLNAGKGLFINGDGFPARSATYNTNGFNLNIGGELQLGDGNDTGLKTLDISNSTVTVTNDIDIRTGTNTLISTNSNIILNGTGAQAVTTNGKAFDTLTQTNASSAGVTFNDGFTVNQLTNTTPNSNMTFTSGETYTINNGVTLQGASGQLITLAPSTAGTHWNFNLNSGATKAIDHVSVSWSDASGSHSTQKRIDPSNSLDDGNTIDWFYKTIITVDKEATLISDPINGSGANKNHIPGAIVKYRITTSNTGTASPDANTVILVDNLDVNVEYDVTTGVTFSDGTTISGLSLGTVSYSHRNSPSDYTYTPTGAFDPNVASLKIETNGVFAFGGSPAPEFSVQFQVRIK